MLNVAIYCRLSKDDGQYCESSSIHNQKEMIIEYVNHNNWNVYDTYIDDGYSGTTFNRPAFIKMIKDIEEKKVQIVIVKDLSRIGRNYIQTGYYLEHFFPENNIRFISINDNYDTINGESEIIPFKNIINEWYAKDISKKISFTLRRMISIGDEVKTVVPIYGYTFCENKKVIDPITGGIVKIIYDEYIKTASISRVVSLLKRRNIYTPGYYNYIKYKYKVNKYASFNNYDKCNWKADTVRKIIRKAEYKGTLIRGKTEKRFKMKPKHLPLNKWHIFTNRLPQIVDDATWEKANNMLNKNILRVKEENIFSGILYCGECHRLLRVTTITKKDNTKDHRFHCRSTYDECGSINESILMKVIEKEINNYITNLDDATILKKVNKLQSNYDKTNIYSIERKQKDLRKEELNRYIQRLVEGYINNEIPKLNYQQLLKSYIEELNMLLTSQVDIVTEEAEIFIKVKEAIKKVLLTRELIAKLIEKIEIKKGCNKYRYNRRSHIVRLYYYE